jgi:hypothetical protein
VFHLDRLRANFRRYTSLKNLPWTNTLAYFALPTVTKNLFCLIVSEKLKKKFYKIGSEKRKYFNYFKCKDDGKSS